MSFITIHFSVTKLFGLEHKPYQQEIDRHDDDIDKYWSDFCRKSNSKENVEKKHMQQVVDKMG